MEKYTYDNWWNGEVTLNYARKVWTKEDAPIIVEWLNFDEGDVAKIKEKQKDIFEQKVTDCVIEIKSNFLKQFEGSLMKGELWRDEIQQCWDIMFAPIPNATEITLNHWDFSFPLGDLMEIQRYIKRKIKKGIQDGYDYIHSPNCKYQDINYRHPQVYAQFVWDYHQWLETNFTTEEEKVVSPPTIGIESAAKIQEPKVELEKSEPQNPYPKIFTSYVGFEIFEAFKSEVITDSTEYADYSYLFGMLKKDDFIHDLKHQKFIDFLAEKYGSTELAKKYNQLKFYKNAETKEKVSAYSRIKKQFQ